MAGISIALKKILKDETYYSQIKGYLYSALAIVGPWVSTVLIINFFAIVIEWKTDLVETEKLLLISSIVYALIFSQIIVAPWQMLLTRYMADNIYSGRTGLIKPSFNGAVKIIFFISGSISAGCP